MEAAAPASLTGGDLAILAIERRPWRTEAAKNLAILDQLGLTPTRYYQKLSELIGNPAALSHDPELVGRLFARRQRRLAQRTGQE